MPTIKYSCIHCGRLHSSYDEAAICEKSHLYPKDIIGLCYRYSPYPVRITVKFEDGEERTYLIYDNLE